MALESWRRSSWARTAGLATMAVTATWLFGVASAAAQCTDPSTHFRGGLWKQWILQITPGPLAHAAVQRVINEMNAVRAVAAFPPLVFDPNEPLAVGFIEENNPRGRDGALLTNRLPNQEVFFATFAEVGTSDSDEEVVIFLSNPLRSNADLTAKGVPGTPATFHRTIKSSLDGTDSEVSTKWAATTTARDQVKFEAEYPSAAISFRGRTPGTTAYLSCNLAKTQEVVYRSLPTQIFGLWDRSQVNVLLDLTRSDVEVSLRVRHHDPDIQAMFNDPANQFLALFELDRLIRFERQ